MRVAPSTSASRGEPVLQPNYFTSSVYASAARDDITTLIHGFHAKHYASPGAEPFATFKTIWLSQGWKWIHFLVFDDRARFSCLNTTMRLFLERMVKTEAPFTRVVTLLGLYTLFYTQPVVEAPPLLSISHLPIPIDLYYSLMSLPDSLGGSSLTAFIPIVEHVLQTFTDDGVFLILPSSELGSNQPRTLPREIYVEDSTREISEADLKKKGRPSKRDKALKNQAALTSLDKWLEGSSVPDGQRTSTHFLLANPPAESLREYQTEKANLLSALNPVEGSPGHAALLATNRQVLDRLRQVQELSQTDEVVGDGAAGMTRVERAVEELSNSTINRGGLLGLLEGAGRPG